MADQKPGASSGKAKPPVKVRRAAPAKPIQKPVPKIGLPTQLATIQNRYRDALTRAGDLPYAQHGDCIRQALATLLAEKAALGVGDGDEAAGVSE